MFLFDSFIMDLPNACIDDTTPPTFAGIASLVANMDGSLTASWSAGSDSSGPVEYDVFIKADDATGLFSASNIVQSVFGLSARIYTLANLVPLGAAVDYFVGVRARDRLGNQEANTVSLSEQSNGVSIGSVNPGDLVLIVQNLINSGIEIVGTIDDDEDLVGTVEDC